MRLLLDLKKIVIVMMSLHYKIYMIRYFTDCILLLVGILCGVVLFFMIVPEEVKEEIKPKHRFGTHRGQRIQSSSMDVQIYPISDKFKKWLMNLKTNEDFIRESERLNDQNFVKSHKHEWGLFFKVWAEKFPSGAFEYVMGNKSNLLSRQKYMITRVWVEKNPEEALRFYEERMPDKDLLIEGTKEWAKYVPDKALQWLNQKNYNEREKAMCLEGMINSVMFAMPEKLVKLESIFHQSLIENESLAYHYMSRLALLDVQMALEWKKSLPIEIQSKLNVFNELPLHGNFESLWNKAVKLDPSFLEDFKKYPGSLQEEVMQEISAKLFSEKGLVEASLLLDKLLPAEMNKTFFLNYYENYSPQKWKAMIETLPEGAVKKEFLTYYAKYELPTDSYEQELEYLGSLAPDDILYMLPKWLKSDPENAKRWLDKTNVVPNSIKESYKNRYSPIFEIKR